MRMFSADDAAHYAVRAQDAADSTMLMMCDITVAVCQLQDPSSLLPSGSDAGTIEVNFDGRQDTIVSARPGDDVVESVDVVQRDDESTLRNKHKLFRKVLRGRRKQRDNF
jgi:hypothetical protein